MSALATQRAQRDTPSARSASAPAVLAQRRSTLGPGPSVTAPPILDAGRPLDEGTRGVMESGFGRDFSHIRVHDDARAHDGARDLNALAYAAGDHIVFGEGAYRPQTPSGQALIAHELAHTIQQGGVQMKAEGPLPAAADAEMEAQADRAARDVTSGRSVGALSRIGQPAVFRATDPPAGGVPASPTAVVSQKLPPGMAAVVDDPAGLGTNELVVEVANFALPLEKGMGPWVKKAYDEAGAGQRLVFSPLIEGANVAAYKEGGEDYKSIWLGNFGFNTTQELANAFRSSAKTNADVKTALADKAVSKLITGMATNLKASGCDIDHIVEKQMGGTSIPSNLQLLDSGKNQASGRETYQELVKLVDAIRTPEMRGKGVRRLQLRLKTATVPAGTSDASYVVEDLLRKGAVKGTDAVKEKAEGAPVSLSAGGVGETIRVRAAGRTPIESMAKRVVPGMRLTAYVRGPGGAKGKTDTVEAELDSRAVSKIGKDAGKGDINLTATLDPTAKPIGAGAGGAAAEENVAAGEIRVLKLSAAKKNVKFYYPYLSPGELTAMELDATGALTGTGTIKPTVPFLGELKIKYGPDLLEVTAPLTADKLKVPIPGFRFTEGSVGLALFPNFVPKADLKFEMGPAGKPVILGALGAKYEGGAFIAFGKLTPGVKIPGISDAAGEVEYNSDKGWAGKLTAKSSSIPNSTINAELGFSSSDKGGFKAYGGGGITTKVKDSDLSLKMLWSGGAVGYSGDVTIKKPLPLVDQVKLEGGYANEVLSLTGKADITWRSIASTMTVTYRRKDGEEGKFSGKADVTIATPKAGGVLNLSFDEEGNYWGKGSIGYQVTKDIRPTLGVELTKDRRVKVSGEVAVGDITLTKKWPKPEGGEITFIKGAGLKFSVPTPLPPVTAFGQIKVSAGLRYGVGPVMLKGLKFNGELYPLEDDPKIKAKLVGSLAVPAYGEIYGTFGAYLGVELAAGLAGAKGGVEVTPSLRIDGQGGIDFDAAYEAEAFTFSAEAYAKGKLTASLKVDLVAELYAAYGLLSHTWVYHAAAVTKQLGPELKLTLGKIAYGKGGEITWPSLSQIKTDPENLDPMSLVKELLNDGKAQKAPGATSETTA